MKRRQARFVERCMLVVSAAALLGLAACSRNDRSVSGCPSASPAAPVDATVMAFLSAARALHHEADAKEQSGDQAGAIAALEKLATMPAPHASEVDEVLADTYARLAEMRLGAKDWGGADRDVRAGLEHATTPTYFRGHLLEVSGRIEEERGAALADAGKSDEAARARARAVDLLESAVKVQEQVIARTLGDGGVRD
jgi:hypothetical protein